jgi:hypothetical protein
MGVKRPVDFSMAPKKAIKGKGVAADPTQEDGWNTSKCSPSDLESLVKQGLLAPGSVIQWRPAPGKDHPYENTGEIFAFTSFLEQGLGFPCSSFFSELLRYYRIQLHHLTPNSFVHISIFVHLCEAFLGIEPHFELFRFLFHLKPQPDGFVLDIVGGAGLQLRQRKDRVYIPYSLSNKVIEWKPKWFFVENQSGCFPPITTGPPIQWPEWNKKPVDENQVSELLGRIAILRQNMLTGEDVVFDWMRRRIQPLQAQETLGFQYQGTADPSRYSKEEISDDIVLSRVQRLLRNIKKVPVVPDAFSAENPPKQVF